MKRSPGRIGRSSQSMEPRIGRHVSGPKWGWASERTTQWGPGLFTCGVMAMDSGLVSTAIVDPGLLVAVVIGVTVLLPQLHGFMPRWTFGEVLCF